MKMKRLLLFVFAVAFLSLLSTSAFAQWGSTVTVSGDTELNQALHNPSVQTVVLTGGYYSFIDHKVADGEMMEKMKPANNGSRAPLVEEPCGQGYYPFPNQCYVSGLTQNLRAFATPNPLYNPPIGGTCPDPSDMTAPFTNWTLYSTDDPNPGNIIITDDPAAPTDPYRAVVSGFSAGYYYQFRFAWGNGSEVISNPFFVWNLPIVVANDASVCSNASLTFDPTVTLPYSGTATYSWSPATNLSNASIKNPIFTNTTPGTYTYTLTVTETKGASGFIPAHTCTSSDAMTVTVVDIQTATTSQTNVSCFGGSNGAASVTPSPTGTYTYLWSPGGQTTASITGLVAGTYTVTVTRPDANSCSITKTVVITQPQSALSASITAQTNVNCFGGATGSVTVLANGGTPAYLYSINNVDFYSVGTFNSLTAGTYTIYVKDANNCTTSVPVTITGPLTAVSVSITAHTDVLCFGLATGEATASASGGTGTITYSWNTSPVQTTATAANLVAGTYTVTVTDNNQCTASATVTISQPASALGAEITNHQDVLCFGNSTGSATVTASGGTGAYSYSWNTSPVQTTATASNLAAGTYTVTVTDANLCTATASVTITQPSIGLSVTTSKVDVLCFGNSTGTATALPAGGTGAYSYSWNTIPVQTTATATGLVAGTYTVTVTDANFCTATASATITQPGSELSATTSQVNVLCFGAASGSATVTASGGTGTYVYSWSTNPVQTTATASGLVAGTYTVTVTDENQCTLTRTVTITQPAEALSVTTTHVDVLCYGDLTGTATAIPAGGTGSYSYSWSTSPAQTTATATGLGAGNYMVFVTDGNGCSSSASAIISQPQSALFVGIEGSHVNCFGGSDGSATAFAYGGTGTITYSWNTDPVQTTAGITGLVAGTYTVTATDANACTATSSITITQPSAPLSASTTQVNIDCFGAATGTISLTVTGGTACIPLEGPPTPYYNYSWTGPGGFTSSLEDLSGLIAGTYTVTVTDCNQCTTTATVVLTQEPDFSVTCHGNVIVCQMAQTFNLIDLGGFGPVPAMAGSYAFYEGINPLTSFNPATAGVGVHTITYQFTNGLGCIRTCDFEILVDPMGAADLEGQVKYWNATETYMPTPFPTDEYGTQPPDYFYVALYEAHSDGPTSPPTTINLADPLANAIDWEKVDITQIEEEIPAGSGNWVVTKDLMSYFKFSTQLQPEVEYFITVWDGSNLNQEFINIGTTTGIVYNPELGANYTWGNWGGVTGTDALGIQYMINGATDINSAPYNWNWIDENVVPGDDYYGFYSYSIGNVNSSLNGITALDRLTTQYRIAGLQPTFPNNTPNFRVSGRFVSTLPQITWPEPFNENQKPIDVEFTKSGANYQYFTPAISHFYRSNAFTTQPFFLTQNTGPIGACPDFGYINLYYEATGDVNASYVPVSGNFKATAPVLQYENEIAVQKGEIIDIPVSIDRSAELGSIAVGLTFRNDLIKVLEVPGFEVVNIDNEKGLVRVVWADPNGKNVSTDEALFTVKAIVLADITSDNRLFELEAMTELGSVDAQPIVDINLKTVAISTKSVVNSEMFVANYPNPFNNKTTISYNLPEAGSVKIVVYNKLGAEVTTLVNQYQTEGTHLVDLNRGDLSAGVYYYKLVLQGTKDTYSATRNMVITE